MGHLSLQRRATLAEEYSMSEQYDVIIIGTGAGGGTLAYKLASSGKKILLLERGGYLPREKDNWSSQAVFVENKYKAKATWKDKDGNDFHPGIHYYVGGKSKVYGAALLRMRHQWIVLRDPIMMSPRQIAQFVSIIGQNARPVQPLHGRRIQEE